MANIEQMIFAAGIGFCSGTLLILGAVWFFPVFKHQRVTGTFTWLLRQSLHQLTDGEVQEVRSILFGGDRVFAELIDKAVLTKDGLKYMGKCACGCGEDLYYKGVGRPPMFRDHYHKGYAQGLRKSPYQAGVNIDVE
jgi:hypothetical protein